MWWAISKDLSDFAQNLKSESMEYVEMFGKIAAHVVGEGCVYAGDEGMHDADEMPLDRETLQQFQECDGTYLTPFTDVEEEAFAEWCKISPFSSLNVQHRASAPSTPAKGVPPTAVSECVTNESRDCTRQHVLNHNETVKRKYMAFVVYPANSRSTQSTPARSSTEGGVPTPHPSIPATVQSDEDTPVLPCHSERFLLVEDAFFDRYYFRLHQLRVQKAKQRLAHKAQIVAMDNAQNVNEEYEPQGPASRIAKTLLRAADEIAVTFDAALVGSRDINSDSENVTPPLTPILAQRRRFIAGTASERETEWDAMQGKVSSLEAVIQELQERLRQEQSRVRQLSAVLEKHAIAAPAPEAAATALRSDAGTPVVVTDTHIDSKAGGTISSVATLHGPVVGASSDEGDWVDLADTVDRR